MMEIVWLYISLLEQREFIMVLIVHDPAFFVFFFIAFFLSVYLIFLVCVSSFRFFYLAEQTNPLIPCLFFFNSRTFLLLLWPFSTFSGYGLPFAGASRQLSFHEVRMSVPQPTPNPAGQVICLCLARHSKPLRLGGPKGT